jgi:hypothetical protein
MTLAIEQQNAITLLMTGLSDREVAEKVGVRRETVTKWRNYHPAFRAELNRQRKELYDQTMDGLRNLIPQAVAALAAEVNDPQNPNRGRIALEVVKMAHLPDDFPSYHGPGTAEEVIMNEAVLKKMHLSIFEDDVTDSDLLQAARELEKKLG